MLEALSLLANSSADSRSAGLALDTDGIYLQGPNLSKMLPIDMKL